MAENTVVRDYLHALLNTGLYGNTLADVRERLVCLGIQRAIRDGVIPQRWVPVSYPVMREPQHGERK